MKLKRWLYLPFIIVLLIIALLLFPFDQIHPITDSVSVTTTTAATTATIKDEPLATTTGTEMTGAITTTTMNTSFADKTETTTQGSSASVTKTTASKPTKTTATKVTKTTAGKKDYLDTSKLTFTQEDVGKVVGYSSLFDEEITVVEVNEDTDLDGLKYIETVLSDYTTIVVIECKYCHEMPCPDGGKESCSQYDVKKDSRVTCQDCGRPKGDGYNGTCLGTIDWENGGVGICHHYD